MKGAYGERILALRMVVDGKVIYDYKEEE